MKVSVALCTYNGGPYLGAQLRSIAGQTRRPDELVVCDDASTDETVALVTAFAQSVPFTVHVFSSERNLGSTRNFERAVSLCKGDVIVLSDQDDVWMSHRMEHIAAAFARRPNLAMAFSDAILADETLRPLGQRLWQTVHLNSWRLRRIERGEAFLELMRGNFVTGATMAVSRVVLDVALPIPPLAGLIHDGWLALVAAALGAVQPIRRPSILYRQHSGQQLGAPKRVRRSLVTEMRSKLDPQTRAWYLDRREDLTPLEVRLHARADQLPDARPLRHLSERRRHYLMRSALPGSRLQRIPAVLAELVSGRYKYTSGLRSVLRDLLLN